MKPFPIDLVAVAVFVTAIVLVLDAPAISENPEDTGGGGICIVDDTPEHVAFGVDYDELFPAGHEYGKDGEIITPDQPIKPQIEQSMEGQSPPPVLYWPWYKQTFKKHGNPCAEVANPVNEPGILASIGAALLAMVLVGLQRSTWPPK